MCTLCRTISYYCTVFYCLLLFGPNGSLYVVVILLPILKPACLVYGKPLPSFPDICIYMYSTSMYVRSNVTFVPDRYVPKEKFSDVVSLGSVLRNRNYLSQFRFCSDSDSGSGSDLWQVTVPVPVPYLDHKKQYKKLCKKSCLYIVQKSIIVA